MIWKDMNQSWKEPEGYSLRNVRADGAYLRVEYQQAIYWQDTTTPKGYNVAVIFLTDMGREIGRMLDMVLLPLPDRAGELKVIPPVAWRFRFWDGLLLVLEGLKEMLTWQNKS